MEQALSTITVFPSNEAELTHYIRTIKDEILSGNIDPLAALKQLKYVERTIAALLKDAELDDYFLSEAEKYGKSFEHLGIKFNIQETGTKYDYKATGDPIWNDINEEKEKISEAMKAREGYLKAIPEEGAADPLTGALIYRAPKTSTTKVVVRL